MDSYKIIGVLKKSTWIISILEQIGLAYNVYENNRELYRSQCGLIFSDQLLPSDKIIISCHKEYGRVKGYNTSKTVGFYYAYNDTNSQIKDRSFFAAQELYTLPGKCDLIGVVYNKDNEEIPGSGIVIEKNIVSLPWDIFSLSFGEESIRRPFYSPVIKKHWVEVGPSIDNGALRRIIEELIYLKTEGSVIKYKRFVDLNKPIFGFRIDADGYTEESTNTMIKIIERTGIRFSWYIDCENWRNALNHIQELKNKNQEIGVHCWHHMTYMDQFVNYINLSWAKRWLIKHGIDVKGIVAPFGYYNSGLKQAIMKNGFKYSSEFAYDVDNLPSTVKTDYWQIPIHVGCIGSLSHYGFTGDEIFRHLRWIIEKQQKENGIAIIYGHPVGRMEKYLDELCDLISEEYKKESLMLTMDEILTEWIKLIEAKEIVERYEIKYPIEDCFVYPSEEILCEAEKGVKYLKEMNGSLISFLESVIYKFLRG